VEYRWQAAKLMNFYLTCCLHRTKEDKERKLCQGARETFLGTLSTCLHVMAIHAFGPRAEGSPPLFHSKMILVTDFDQSGH